MSTSKLAVRSMIREALATGSRVELQPDEVEAVMDFILLAEDKAGMRTPDRRDQAYLGDGVVASNDGYHIWLQLVDGQGGPPIALDPSVFARLVAYRDRLLAMRDQNKEQDDA